MTVSLTTAFGDSEDHFSPLTSKKIQRCELKYQNMLEALCVKYALDFKNILIEEYGYNILSLEKQLPLTTHFGFQLSSHIWKVTNAKRDKAVGVNILERVKTHIVQQYNAIIKDSKKEVSFRKVKGFIKQYQEFSSYVSKEFVISQKKSRIDQAESSRSWLVENLRYLFPKKFGLPLEDNLLSWFVYRDTPSHNVQTKLKRTTSNKESFKRILLSELLAIDYKISKLTKKMFNDKGVIISNENLEILKKRVSFLIYFYVFGGYQESMYVSKTTSAGLKVGENFFTLEYEIIRALFFAAAEVNDGEPITLKTIKNTADLGVSLDRHLAEGYGFGDDMIKLLIYFNKLSENRPLDSDSIIFRDGKEILEGYHDAYRARNRVFQKSREHRTEFQGKVHVFIENFLGLKFEKEEQVRGVIKEDYVTVINGEGIKENIRVHHAFKFDGYLELTRSLREYLGLDDKWTGVAIEALGTYWHSLPAQKEADRKKRLICREKNIILLEILEALDSSKWGVEILRQFKELTGVEIPQSKLGKLGKYLGKV